MLNPSLSNFVLDISDEFFPKELVQKYENFIKHMNHPFKIWKTNLLETVQSINIPGLNISPLTVSNLNNTNPNLISNPGGVPHTTNNHFWEGNEPWSNVIESMQFTISLRNNILNYMYFYEFMYKRYQRTDRTDRFMVILNMLDSAEIPVIKFIMGNCFLVNVPSLNFSFNESFNESKQFDIQIQTNKFDVEFNIPDFNYKPFEINR